MSTAYPFRPQHRNNHGRIAPRPPSLARLRSEGRAAMAHEQEDEQNAQLRDQASPGTVGSHASAADLRAAAAGTNATGESPGFHNAFGPGSNGNRPPAWRGTFQHGAGAGWSPGSSAPPKRPGEGEIAKGREISGPGVDALMNWGANKDADAVRGAAASGNVVQTRYGTASSRTASPGEGGIDVMRPLEGDQSTGVKHAAPGEDWQQQIIARHPEIGVAGTKANADFVRAYKAAHAAQGPNANGTNAGGAPVDHMALADQVMGDLRTAQGEMGPPAPIAPTPLPRADIAGGGGAGSVETAPAAGSAAFRAGHAVRSAPGKVLGAIGTGVGAAAETAAQAVDGILGRDTGGGTRTTIPPVQPAVNEVGPDGPTQAQKNYFAGNVPPQATSGPLAAAEAHPPGWAPPMSPSTTLAGAEAHLPEPATPGWTPGAPVAAAATPTPPAPGAAVPTPTVPKTNGGHGPSVTLTGAEAHLPGESGGGFGANMSDQQFVDYAKTQPADGPGWTPGATPDPLKKKQPPQYAGAY